MSEGSSKKPPPLFDILIAASQGRKRGQSLAWFIFGPQELTASRKIKTVASWLEIHRLITNHDLGRFNLNSGSQGCQIDLPEGIPTGFKLSAQSCEERATLGENASFGFPPHSRPLAVFILQSAIPPAHPCPSVPSVVSRPLILHS